MVASRPTVMAPPRTSAAPRAFLAQWRARPHRRLVGVSVVCLEPHEGRMIRAREAHQRLAAAFRDLDTDGSGFVDRPKLCAALESYGLPRGEDYVDELMAQYKCDEFGAITFADYRTYAGARERATRRAWREVLGSAHHRPAFPGWGDGTDRDRTGDDRNARADVFTVLEATKRAGIDGVDAADAQKMVSLLSGRGRNGSAHDAVTYEEFRRYAALLPDAQLRSGNATWDWLAAAAPEREHGKPRGQRRKQLFAGGLAGIVGRTAVAPLDRARTIIQDMGLVRGPASSVLDKSGIVHTTKPPNAAQVCRDVLRNEGPAGLFRGNMVSALKVVPANALQFAIFHKMKDDFLRARSDKDGAPAEQLLLEERLASGAVAGALSTAACYPLDTLKSQMAVAGGLRGSVVTAATQLFRDQGGLRAFYKGIGPTLLCDVIGSALGFTLYETFQTMYREANQGRRPNPLEKGALGGLGACVSLTLTMPLEVVMTRMRVQGLGHRPVLYKNALECLRLSVQREGLKSLWLGTGAAYVKIFPQLAITYFVFELASEQLGVGGLGRYERSKPVTNKAVDEGKPSGPVAA